MVLGEVCVDVSNPNMFVHEYITSHMNLIQKHVILDESCIDTQGRFKANLSNVMDIFGRLTSKLPIYTIITHLRILQPHEPHINT